ncbi:MAG: CHAD domain-containing protein [Gemmatimonadota bacterium]|nr:CHAD domain-containing protein [Gemmatimonadota bacterium]
MSATDNDVAATESDKLRLLLDGALQETATVGVRVVALWWLHRLHRARARWAESTANDGTQGERATDEVLHNARVETRRLRGALRDYQTELSDSVRPRDLKRLRALNRVMSTARDADVACAWLSAEADTLPEDARAQAVALRDALARDARNNSRRVTRAFEKQFDAHTTGLGKRLSRYRVAGTIGSDGAPSLFSAFVAKYLQRLAVRIIDALAEVTDVSSVAQLHRVRRALKGTRDLLHPFISQKPAFGALYEVATRAQDVLGAMRDAQQLAERARVEEFWALAAELDNVALGHYNTFATEWKHEGEILPFAHFASALIALQVPPEPHLSNDSPKPVNSEGAPLEIERKYLLRGCPPEAAVVPGIRVEQGWLPGETLRERLRRSTYPTGVVRHTRTVKFGGGISRVELEEDTERLLFDILWPHTKARRVYKRRHAIREGAFTWEIDVFTDRNLVLAEVELNSESEQAPLPKWLLPWVVREVTGEREFYNANLARPEEHAPPPVAELQSL